MAMFQPYADIAKRLRSAVLARTGRRLADVAWVGDPYNTVCLLVRDEESKPWRVWDALYIELNNGKRAPRNICAGDIDRLIQARDAPNTPDPLDTEKAVLGAADRHYRNLTSDATDDAIASQQEYDRRFGKYAPGGSAGTLG